MMKKIVVILSIILSIGLFSTASAQTSINVNINSQPAWGPTGYDNANFYYMPDLNIYFDINNSVFYYLSGSKWVSNRYLPNSYSKYDLYNTYKVVINNSSKPWLENKSHKKNYSQYKQNKTQIAIRNSNDNRYKESKNNTRSWTNAEQQSNKNVTDSSNKNKTKSENVNNKNESRSKQENSRQRKNKDN